MTTGVFPQNWKVALVCPIHKAGQMDRPENYRPISLLSILSKVMEKIINKRLVNYLEKNSLLSERQFGFRSGKCTENAVELLTNTVTGHVDHGKRCLGVFIDLTKAFDTVSNILLLRKMESLGIRGTVLNWFRSYLSNRRQRVKIDNQISDEQGVSFGVPQGSLLGPTLFTIYIDEILRVDIQDADLFCYADDTAIIFHGSNWNEVYARARSGMRKIADWLDINLLTLNINKSKYIAFRKTRATELPDFCIKLHNTSCSEQDNSKSICSCAELERVDHIKYLGITLDQNLSFKQHISILSKRVRKLIYVMKLLRDNAPLQNLKLVYTALCQSLLQYCQVIWGGAAKTHMLGLERSQRAVLKVMLRKPFRYHTEALYLEAGLLGVRKLYIYNVVCKVYKVSGKKLLVTHSKRKSRIPPVVVRSTFAQRLPTFLHTHIFNKIASLIHLRDPIATVKHKLKNYLMNWSYNDIEQYFFNIVH